MTLLRRRGATCECNGTLEVIEDARGAESADTVVETGAESTKKSSQEGGRCCEDGECCG